MYLGAANVRNHTVKDTLPRIGIVMFFTTFQDVLNQRGKVPVVFLSGTRAAKPYKKFKISLNGTGTYIPTQVVGNF